ncbi:hypothetical protein HNP48_003014 [Acidovorax soli]|jgi:hypothetical protein|uniref:Uncharacterized protein n=1 Tax=Acidovorax soli TaxID=592050 RepID=A0A7X0UAA3_9BURK|nr:hypothetical protein [Acidovorax soli]
MTTCSTLALNTAPAVAVQHVAKAKKPELV